MVGVHVQVLVAARPGIEDNFEQTLLLETEINGTQPLETSHQESRAQQQNEGEGNLRDDKRFAHSSSSAGPAARVLLEHGSRILAGGMQGRNDSKEDSGQDAQ